MAATGPQGEESMDRSVCRRPEKIKGAMWNYLRENKDYPYYMIKDRLARAEADSVAS